MYRMGQQDNERNEKENETKANVKKLERKVESSKAALMINLEYNWETSRRRKRRVQRWGRTVERRNEMRRNKIERNTNGEMVGKNGEESTSGRVTNTFPMRLLTRVAQWGFASTASGSALCTAGSQAKGQVFLLP